MARTIISGKLLADAKIEKSGTDDVLKCRVGLMRYDSSQKKEVEVPASIVKTGKPGSFDKMIPYLKKDKYVGAIGAPSVKSFTNNEGQTFSWVEIEATTITFGSIENTTIEGRLVADAEYKVLQSGVPILNFRVVYDVYNKAEKQRFPVSVSCTKFGYKDAKMPFKLLDYLKKGKAIQVVGKINAEQYNGGDKIKTKMTMVVEDYELLEFLLPKQTEAEPAQAQAASTDPDDDLPF